MSIEIHFNHQRKSVEAGVSLFDLAEALGLAVPTSCRKNGRCKECMVDVDEGMELLTPRGPEERHLRENFRLACCARIIGDSGAIRCHTLRRGSMRIEQTGLHCPGNVPERPDPAVTRDGDRVLLDGVEIDRYTGPIHGLAMDLGTTTVVLRLLNLETGKIVAHSAFENPQRFGGSDVMARIQYDCEDGTHLLQRALAAYLARAIREFPVGPQSIYEMTVAGNSTMRDLFFGLSVYPIGQSPYESITQSEFANGLRTTTAVSSSPEAVELPLNPRGRVYGLPLISGHVGADAAACMLAVGLEEEDRVIAIMDLGTNTELILGNRNKVLAASCPAGPAFEGGRITCGMPGLRGAIESVAIQPDSRIVYKTIEDAPAEGICGSGLVDLMGELSRTGRIHPLGRFRNGESRIVLTEGADPVFLEERDMSELAQAKGATTAGLRILFEEYGVNFQDVDRFYLAGGFGRHLNLESAKRIGLIPNLPLNKYVQVGNAAIEGASLALLSQRRRRALERLVRRVEHCRLEAHSHFFDYFVDGCHFRSIEPSPLPSKPADARTHR